MTHPPFIPDSWASGHIEKLSRGLTVQFRPRGHSMEPLVPDGALVTVVPDIATLCVGDVVLVRVRGRVLFHKVTARVQGHVQIGNNKGHINGWVPTSAVYGRCIKVDRPEGES